MASRSPAATKPLTERQQSWLKHINACRAEGGSMRAYARAHGLSVAALYTAQHDLIRRGALKRSDASDRAATFVPVRVHSPVPTPVPKSVPIPMMRIVLPNGVVIEVPEHAELARCQILVAALMGVQR